MSGGGSRLIAVAVLLAVYLFTLGSLAWGDVAVGIVLAAAIEVGWRRRTLRGGAVGDPQAPSRVPLGRRLAALPRLVFAVFVEIARGTWIVALFSLGIREPVDEGMVEIALEGISEEGVAAWAFISTISPGEIVVDIDERRGVLVIHTLDASDPDAIRRRHHDFYVRYQRKVLP